jgi:hypothetical protein
MEVRRTELQKDKLSPYRPPLPVSGLGTVLNAGTQQAKGTSIMSETERCHRVGFAGTPYPDHTRVTVGGEDRR